MPVYDRRDADADEASRHRNAIRRQPGMNVGDTEDGSGLRAMIHKAVDYAAAEVRAGRGTLVVVTLDADGSITVGDDGPGMPTRIDHDAGMSAAEVIMSGFEAGTGFRTHPNLAPRMTARQRRRWGLVVVNTLSTRLRLRIWRDGREHEVEFAGGDPVHPLRVVGPAGLDKAGRPKRGTAVTFWPSRKVFAQSEVDRGLLKGHLRKVARIRAGLRIELTDARRAAPALGGPGPDGSA